MQFQHDKVAHNDPNYSHKNDFAKADIILTNLLTKPEIVFMNPAMIQEMVSPERFMLIPK